MEVVAATPGGGGVPPFHDHDVREWSRIDSITGALERARLETDRWSANTINSSHNYGKVVDSRARTEADGALQQQARRQLEVFQSQIPGGHLQVIKTHTVSSSRWTNKNVAIGGNGDGSGFGSKDFENLQLTLNPLDLSSQKSKASVGRSATRRPPSRQRPRDSPSTSDLHNSLRNAHLTAATNLHRVSRLCHQIHENAVRQAFGRPSPKPAICDRQNGDGSVEIYEIESVSSCEAKSLNGHTNLSRTKSTSSDDINLIPEKDSSTKSVEDLEDLEQLQNWRRTSKIRRSLQFPKENKTTNSKPVDLPENSVSVRKIREDLEKGRRLNTALRNNSVDLEALDQILQSISSSSSIHSDKTSDTLEDENEQASSKKQKRNSFVTVESIQEVKGRLRRTSSPTNDIYKVNGNEEDPDDGIGTEDGNKEMTDTSLAQSRVRSYVYGMEALLNKKPGIGTGSLESRVKQVNGNLNNRSEDWYNRRKSYGFEQVHSHEDSSNSISHKTKNIVESSTDSGICRSTEIVVVPTATKSNLDCSEENNQCSSDNNSDYEQKCNGYNSKHQDGINFGKVKKMASTFNQDDRSPLYNKTDDEQITNSWNKFSSNNDNWNSELKSTTITIPIVKNNNIVDLSWNDEPEREIKRHSIAVDESKYVTKASNENKFRRTSLALNDQFMKQDDDDMNTNRKPKKVEFCKTEVHFAAESGKVNIVATDEKPPPTQNFRRRRRITNLINEDFNKNGLPVLHFGDSTDEKTMFGIPDTSDDNKNNNLNSIYENLLFNTPQSFGVVTVNTNNNINSDFMEEDKKELENENIKGILKNKPIKPKPYHLGEPIPFTDTGSDNENRNWGVRLKHIEKEDAPIWKSTVTVHNYYDKQSKPNSDEEEQPEFQKLLKNLRPTKKSEFMSDNENRYSDSFSSINVVSPLRDNRRSSWSVADKVKAMEDTQGVENKGYSTKVNIGGGEATVVQSDNFYEKDRHPTWPRMENSAKESKQILNRGLVVRIGREDSASNHTVCSKMTTTQDTNNKTTTTKITIDLSPSPPSKPNDNCFTYAKYQRSQNHSFKSTSLILNTIKDNQAKKLADNKTGFDNKNDRIPQQLEALKKLYEDVQSDSDADKEVQQLMSKITEKELSRIEDDDNSSVVSGSWSKMRAYKNISNHFSKTSVKEATRYDLKLNTKLEKDATERVNQANNLSDAYTSNSNPSKHISSSRRTYSPIALRKAIPVINRPDLKSAVTTEKLSSPFLVGKNTSSFEHTEEEHRQPIPVGRHSPSKDFKNSPDRKLQSKHNSDNIVLRQPKKSEMTYFGVNLSPKPVKKISQAVIRKENKLSSKPDLLQHYKKSPSPTRNIKINTKVKPRHKSPETKNDGPIYENLKETKGKYTREFDSSILDELTKAADQILQAVNGYTDEDSHNRFSTDEEESKKQREPLETISETKSWKQQSQTKPKPSQTKTKLRHTSSTSSVESISCRRVTSVERKTTTPVKTTPERAKKKVEKSDNSTAKANTKARRLQRASSREALLQSHGSSSEDLAANVEAPVRKPRLVKKTKAMQLSVTNGFELKKMPSSSVNRKKEESSSKTEERILSSLPEIRHKTAVSTIRSTADKCSRDRTRHRSEETKKKLPQKKEGSRGVTSSVRSDREKTKTTALNKETVTHRISTANIKKCHRSDGGPRH